MKESTKILLYGLLASIVLILLCLYTHQDELKNEIKESQVRPINRIEKKEEVINPSLAIKPIVQEEPIKKIKGIEEVLTESSDVADVKKVAKINEIAEKKEDINKIESKVPSLVNEHASFKKKELVKLTEHTKSKKVDQKVEISDKNLLIKDNIPLIDNEKKDKKKEEDKKEKSKKEESKKDDRLKSGTQESLSTAQKQISKIVSHNISFYKNRAKITNKGQRTLNRVIKVLKKVPDVKILVKGYTDASGKKRINQWISEERAKSVKKYLGKHGIALKNIEAKGFGETELLYGNKPYSTLNRRVEIEIKRK